MRAMFSTVAPSYDFFIRTFSYGMDKRWKEVGVEPAGLPRNPMVLDLASGTRESKPAPLPVKPVFVHQRLALFPPVFNRASSRAWPDPAVAAASPETLPPVV
jgi:hypothetical protein